MGSRRGEREDREILGEEVTEPAHPRALFSSVCLMCGPAAALRPPLPRARFFRWRRLQFFSALETRRCIPVGHMGFSVGLLSTSGMVHPSLTSRAQPQGLVPTDTEKVICGSVPTSSRR